MPALTRPCKSLVQKMTISLLPDDHHDQTLLNNVRPPDWINPTPKGRYTLAVIGAGTAGLVCAAAAAGLGAKVALIERELLGGDCLNAGCVPSKALLASARVAANARHASRVGVHVPGGIQVDFPAVMERLRRLRAGLSPHDSAARFRSLGVDVFLGQGRFTSRDSIEVNGQTIRFVRGVIATGARAAHPEIPGLAETGYFTNENVFTLTALPSRLAVLGAGPIGCELAQAFARFGSNVTLIDRNPRILHREDAEAACVVQQALQADGVTFLGATEVTRVEHTGQGKTLHLKDASTITVDEILVGAGRRPNIENLSLETAGVVFTAQGVSVDDHLRTSNSRVFAAGDICSHFRFTHAADAMARIVVQNALFPGRARLSSLHIPWCTYTDPELAHIGLSEEEARNRTIPYRIFVQSFDKVDRAVLEDRGEGFVKVLVKPGTDRILGATIVSADAGELMGELSLALTHGLGLRKLAATIHPYPTRAEALRKLGDAYNRTRLTPWTAWLIKQWLSWFRS